MTTRANDELLERLAAQRREAAVRRELAGGPVTVGRLLEASDPLAPRAGCPAPARLEAYVAGRLPARQREQVRQHLTTCCHCRTFARSLRELVSQPAPVPAAPLPPRPAVLSAGHILGLTVAGLLFIIANTAIIDVVARLDQLSPVSTRQPAEREERALVPPAPVITPAEPVEARPEPAPVAEPDATDEGDAAPAADKSSPVTSGVAHEPPAKRLPGAEV